MTASTGFEVPLAGQRARLRQIGLPELFGRLEEQLPGQSQVICLGKQMGQCKAQIEGRVAVVDHLMVEQDQAALVDQDVLGTEIPMHHRPGCRLHVADELRVKVRRGGIFSGGEVVVGIDPQLLKKVAVLNGANGRFIEFRSLKMDPAEKGSKLYRGILRDLAPQQDGFPVLVRIGHRFHPQKKKGRILKDERGEGSGRGQVFQKPQSESFALDARGIGMPVRGHPQFFEGLFDDDAPRRSPHEDGFVGDSASQDHGGANVVLGKEPPAAEIVDQIVRLLDVERNRHAG